MAEESLHDVVTAAFDQATTTPAPATESPAPAGPPADSPAPSGGNGADPGSPGGYLEPKPASAASQTPADRGDGRDTAGRFAPKTPPEGAPEAPAATPAPDAAKPPDAPVEPVQPVQPGLKAPSSWKPAIREHWAALPPAVQQEVTRRELDMQRYMGETKQVHGFAQQMAQAMQPYAADINLSAGGDMVRFNAGNAQAYHTIFHGGPEQKAQFIANLIAESGTDTAMLDGFLARRLQNGPQPTPQPVQPQVDVRQAVEEALAEQAKARLSNQAAREVEAFGQNPKYEHFDVLRKRMGALMTAADEDGEAMTLEQAYDIAAAAHPEIGPLLRKKADEARTKAAADAAAQARRAAVSLPSGGAPQGTPDGSVGDNRRAAVEAAFRQHERTGR